MSLSRSRSRTSRAAPATSGERSPTCGVGQSPQWLRTRLHRLGCALDLERCRRNELRHADVREPAACVRPRPAAWKTRGRATRARARASSHARQRRANADGRRSGDHRRRAGHCACSDHGRPGHRGHRRDDRGSARGRQLRTSRHSSDVRAPGTCAPKARTAGRRASTHSKRGSPQRLPLSCSSSCAVPRSTPRRTRSPNSRLVGRSASARRGRAR